MFVVLYLHFNNIDPLDSYVDLLFNQSNKFEKIHFTDYYAHFRSKEQNPSSHFISGICHKTGDWGQGQQKEN